jgi:hypothetical protein
VTSARYYSRIEGRWGWVAETGGCVAGWAHPLEKSATGFEDTSIHRIGSRDVNLRGKDASRSDYEPRNDRRNAKETEVL